MTHTPWLARSTALLLVAVAGCSPAGPPPDEAKTKVFGNKAATPQEMLAAAQQYYPPATADYFHDMDTESRYGKDEKAAVPVLTAEQIKGRNAWVMWAGGNEAFWDWLARHSYGSIDLLKLVDSQERGKRFNRRGVITEPGTRPPTDDETRETFGVRYDRRVEAGEAGKVHVDFVKSDREPARQPPDPAVYGYSSGVVGLRLYANPEFVGDAKARWNPELYYRDTPEGRSYATRPDTIRPFRVGMACGFCHIAPHPLVPPTNPEFPEWVNLSNNIGNQYMRFRTVFANVLKSDNLLYHVVDAQHPGTIDTSLVAADNINNPNTVNAFFGLPGRVKRAAGNPKEVIGAPTLDFLHSYVDKNHENPAYVPRVLLDGSDSVGVPIALARVYLNIGTYHQQWVRTHNPLLGFRKQDPFTLKDTAENSLSWHGTMIRVQPLFEFFMKTTDPMRLRDVIKTAKLAKDDKVENHIRGDGYPWNPEYKAGRGVFARGCVACHSSVQPGDVDEVEEAVSKAFAKRAEDAAKDAADKKLPPPPPQPPLPADRTTLRLRMEDLARLARGNGQLPTGYEAWAQLAVGTDEFWRFKDKKTGTTVHNFLSTDRRIPVTLMGTNSARAMATNALTGDVWEDFASETYKHLDSVGRVTYHDPISGSERSFPAPAGGPGYYRPPPLVSAWATAPFLHNNALGKFNNDPSVKGRLEAFDDAIDRLLWVEKRAKPTRNVVWPVNKEAAEEADNATEQRLAADGGWVWRTSEQTWVMFGGPHVPIFVAGILGLSPFWQAVLPWLPTVAFVVLGVTLLFSGRIAAAIARLEVRVAALGYVFRPIRWTIAVLTLLLGVGAGLVLKEHWYLVDLLGVGLHQSRLWLGLQVLSLPLFFLAVSVLFFTFEFRTLASQQRKARLFGAACLVWSVILALGFGRTLSGRGGDVKFGPFPAGMPVNLIANMHPKPPGDTGAKAREALIDYLLDYQRAGDGEKPGLKEFEARVAPFLIDSSKCPDFVTDRGHDLEFIRRLTDQEKNDLKLLLQSF